MAHTDDTPPDDLSGLPPSALLIVKVLEDIEPATKQQLVDESLMNERTTYNALDRLGDEGIIDSRPSDQDARQYIYWLAVDI